MIFLNSSYNNAGWPQVRKEKTGDNGLRLLPCGGLRVSETLHRENYVAKFHDLEEHGKAVVISDDVCQDGVAGQAGVHACTEGARTVFGLFQQS